MRIPFPLVPKPVRWLTVIVVAGLIFYASILTAPPETAVDGTQPGFAPLDKWRHFVAYATLATALAYAIDHWERDRWAKALLVIAVAALYGVGIEVGQSFDPERYFDTGDMLVNAVGSSCVIGWYAIRPHLDPRPVEDLARNASP